MIETCLAIIEEALKPLKWSLTWINIVEILIIAVTLFLFYRKFIKNTQSEKLVKGIFILIFMWIMSEVLILINLRILGLFMKGLVAVIALSLIVIFQPELRRFLGYLGQPGFIGKTLFSKESHSVHQFEEVDFGPYKI